MIWIVLLLVSLSAHAEEITGSPHVIDGDSIRIADVEIRLHGIDAPEWQQMCKVKGKDWTCGRAATDTLSFLSIGAPFRKATAGDGGQEELGSLQYSGRIAFAVDHGLANLERNSGT